MAKLVAATASARDPLVFTRHTQSVRDCTSRKGGVPPSARSSICCRSRPNPSPIHSQCSACAFSMRMFSIRKVREKSSSTLIKASAGRLLEERTRRRQPMALCEVHSDLAQRRQTHLAVHGLADGFLAHHMSNVVDCPHHREIDCVMRHILDEAAVDLEEVHG